MAEILKVQVEDEEGNIFYIHTAADIVFCADGKSVEEKLEEMVEREPGKGLSSNDYTRDEKDKLAGIAENANNYVHPTGDGYMHIPASGSSNPGLVLVTTSTPGVYEWLDIVAALQNAAEEMLTEDGETILTEDGKAIQAEYKLI